ncbi:hypothetical protein K431DRAFT_324156 [Polychaeton citri CBS 116435]|uniref:MFS general substrate transporter n=1 Tax=Polychaeton citri CBS 116435 TaxID=1314669 RepID=A0A9P4UKG4_9PEZI|nr:hypothetical protein K431DRAFT_324156 [Polychaeton citri CBS 116435]
MLSPRKARDTFDKSPEERKFLGKLNAVVLTYVGSNINNAFISRMKEDLSLYKNQLNYIYTVLTFATSRCNTAQQLYVMRFFVSLAESGFYPNELAKQSCIFHTCSAIASMFSGYLMAAVYHLGGVSGFKGWQWLFIVDGIISLLHIYALTLLYIFFNVSNTGSTPVFAQYLKESVSLKYEVWQINSSDTFLKGRRWPPIVFGGCINIICYACFILMRSGYGLSGLCMAWAAEICLEDREEHVLVGYITIIFLVAGLIVNTFVVRQL